MRITNTASFALAASAAISAITGVDAADDMMMSGMATAEETGLIQESIAMSTGSEVSGSVSVTTTTTTVDVTAENMAGSASSVDKDINISIDGLDRNNDNLGAIMWEETFDYQGGVNSKFWNYDEGRGIDGWGNQELQTYTSHMSNVRVNDGALELTAIRESPNSANAFTSGRINTKDKVLFKYGTLEARIQIPDVVEGLWPAFWTLGHDFDRVDWPNSG